MDSERHAARARHPSAWWLPDHDRLRRLVAQQLAGEGHRWPLFGATLLAVRGVLALDREAFANLLGITADDLRAMEEGREGPSALGP